MIVISIARESQEQSDQLRQFQLSKSQQAERALQEYKVEMEHSTSQLFQQMKNEVKCSWGHKVYILYKDMLHYLTSLLLYVLCSCRTWRQSSTKQEANWTRALKTTRGYWKMRGRLETKR